MVYLWCDRVKGTCENQVWAIWWQWSILGNYSTIHQTIPYQLCGIWTLEISRQVLLSSEIRTAAIMLWQVIRIFYFRKHLLTVGMCWSKALGWFTVLLEKQFLSRQQGFIPCASSEYCNFNITNFELKWMVQLIIIDAVFFLVWVNIMLLPV